MADKVDFKDFYKKNIIKPEQYEFGKLKLISPIPVSVNHFLKPRAFIMKINGKNVPQVTMYETAEAKYYKKGFSEYVKQEVKNQNWDIESTKTKHHYMKCTFYFARIDQDEQNYYKIMCDSMNKIAYNDDNFILTSTNRIYYDSKNPRIEIEIYPVDYIGIFDNNDDLQTFENKCHTCSRYKNNCSILNKAIEGRIIEEVQNKQCTKYKEVKR